MRRHAAPRGGGVRGVLCRGARVCREQGRGRPHQQRRVGRGWACGSAISQPWLSPADIRGPFRPGRCSVPMRVRRSWASSATRRPVLAMQKVVGSSRIIRSYLKPAGNGGFSCSQMTRESAPGGTSPCPLRATPPRKPPPPQTPAPFALVLLRLRSRDALG